MRRFVLLTSLLLLLLAIPPAESQPTAPHAANPPAAPNSQLSVVSYGADPTGRRDSSGAIQAALDAGAGRVVSVPPGRYRCNRTLTITKALVLAGTTPGGWYASTHFVFPPGVAGLVIRDVPGKGIAQGTAIRDLAILGSGGTRKVDGLSIHSRVTLRDVCVRGFSGNGVSIVASVPSANANMWRIEGGIIDQCGGDGLYLQGNDVNSGTCTGLMCNENRGWGFHDASFLGNTYLGCLTQGNAKGPYWVDGGVNYSLLLGCYAEGGQPRSRLAPGAFWFGGTTGTGVDGGQVWLQGNVRTNLISGGDTTMPPLTVADRKGLMAPVFAVMNQATDVMFAISGSGCVGLGKRPEEAYPGQNLEHPPRLQFHVHDKDPLVWVWANLVSAGFNAKVAELNVGADGPAFGEGWLSLRGIGPDAKAVEALRVKQDRVKIGNGGLQLPSLNAAERAALPNRQPGLLVWGSDTNAVMVWDGKAWKTLSGQ